MADADRPDPDALLARLRDGEAEKRRGRLRIYFGASAGVGKTFAMLGAAQREQAAGRDVLVGVVETHGRRDTAELLAGLPELPPKQVPYRGRALKEFDLDAALQRQPALLLVDELAHTNAPGSRHPKRWQDVSELLDAGIDVWSAVNVQHLESLNGTVGAITGIPVHETVPDTVLDEADELVLIDVTPDELLARLKAGKVYLPQQAERAAQNFFRKGNLIALREIALRRTAQHVEDDVRSYRVEASIAPVWHTEGAILACVGPGESASQTVRTASRLAARLNVRWHAAYVETPRLQRLPDARRDGVLAVLRLAEELGADTTVLTGHDVAAELVARAQALNCATLVVGRSQSRVWPWSPVGVGQRLSRIATDFDVVEAGQSDRSRRLPHALPRSDAADVRPDATRHLPRYAWAVAASVAVTVLAAPLHDRLALANIVMLFLLGVVGVGYKLGRGPAALAAVLNVAAFDFFFVAPQLSFAVSDVQYVLTFAVMLGVGLLTGQLTAGLRFQARIAASREQRAQALFELSRDLSGALLSSQVAELGGAAVQRTFGGEAVVLLSDGALGDPRVLLPETPPEGLDAGVAGWVLRQGQPAGLATATLSAQLWHYVPLRAPMRLRGVLALKPAQPRWLLIPEQLQQLDTLARQIAIALERVHYVEVAQQALVEMESERLRNALLAAISHDVRTPLTAVVGLAESLERALPPTNEGARNTARAISGQARELAALVNNLLDMARLQHGAVTLRSDWNSVEELVGAAIRAAGPALAGRPVRTEVPADLPLVEFDATLMERVLVNLLENAAKYGAPPIVLAARVTPDALALSVRDHGPGLPPGSEQQLFDKFRRGEAESATPGVGLGLAICKAAVLAHGGRIEAGQAQGGGAVFTITLPRRAPPTTDAAAGE